MNRNEAMSVLEHVRGYQPNTRTDVNTVAAWAAALAEYEAAEALRAVDALFATPAAPDKPRWITPSNVAWQIKAHHDALRLAPGWREVVCEVCRRPRFEHDEAEAKVKTEHRHEFVTFAEHAATLARDAQAPQSARRVDVGPMGIPA